MSEPTLSPAWSALLMDLFDAINLTAVGKYTPALHPRRVINEHRAAIEAEARAPLEDRVRLVVRSMSDWLASSDTPFDDRAAICAWADTLGINPVRSTEDTDR